MKDTYKSYEVSSVCLADLISEGYDTKNITDDDMRTLASKMGDAFTETGAYWDALHIICDEVLKIKKIK